MESVDQYWRNKLLIPIGFIFLVFGLTASFYLASTNQDKRNEMISITRKMLSGSISNSVVINDTVNIKKIIGSVGQQLSVRIIVSSKNLSTLAQHSLTSFTIDSEKNDYIYSKINDQFGNTVGYLGLVEDDFKKSSYKEVILITISFLFLVSLFFFLIIDRTHKIYKDLSLLASLKADSKYYFMETHKIMRKIQSQTSELVSNAKLKAFHEVANKVAHDIRSPLEAIQYIKEDIQESIDEETSETFDFAVNRIMSISEDLLSKSRSRSEKITLNELETQISLLISEKKINTKNSNISFSQNKLASSPDNKKAIMADPVVLGKSLSNLLNNSIEACTDQENPKVELDIAQNGQGLRITVSDNGKGMDRDLLDALNSGKSVTSGKKNGNGIGVSSSINDLKKHNIKLSYQSRTGAGTTANIDIPLISH